MGDVKGIIAVQREDFDAGARIEAAKQAGSGAVVTFVGVVRDDGIESMEVEAYEEVALDDLARIRDEATAEFGLRHVTIIHRIGTLLVGDNILLIVVSAGHRKEGFLGCESILEKIKERVPFWKREVTKEGDRWVRGHME